MNMRNFLIALAIVSVVGVSGAFMSPVSALTADELQAQIRELLAKVAELTKQLNALRGEGTAFTDVVVPAVNVNVAPRHRICAILYRNLAAGILGDDVKSLQEFLRDEGYFSANATGYFGELTREALKRWQAAQGVVSSGDAQTTGWGVLGPQTRERIKIWCGGGGWVGHERFSVSPQRGVAPLSVVFSTWISGFRVPNISYTIDFGDGMSERAANCPAPADACTGPGQNNHTYSTNGTYTATLNKITDPCPDDGDPNTPRCLAAVRQEVVGKVQIHVGSDIACTEEYRPVCGAKPIVCITTPCNPVQQTYSNRCMMNTDGATFLYEGVCRNDAGNKQPVIHGFSGPTTLQVNETGTWSVKASDPEEDALSYRVIWGDEDVQEQLQNFAGLDTDAFVQSATFTHAYANPGLYLIRVTVHDSAGKEVNASVGVKVGDAPIACTQEAKQCPDGSYVGRTGPNCEFKCPATPRPFPPLPEDQALKDLVCPFLKDVIANPNVFLAEGQQGDHVRRIQELLHAKGFLNVNPTGYFGTLTLSALQKWLADLPVPTGIGYPPGEAGNTFEDLQRWQKLLADLPVLTGIGYPPGEAGNTFEDLQRWQKLLADLPVPTGVGYPPGTLHWGAFDRATYEQAFQRIKEWCAGALELPPVPTDATLGASCTLDGATVAHDQSRTFYSTNTVPSGQTCAEVGQVRTCTNGTLSGSSSYNRASCTTAVEEEGGTPSQTSPFSVTPQSGPAPLTVAFVGSMTDYPDAITNSSYKIRVTFGDSSAPVEQACVRTTVGSTKCSVALSLSHTYATQGNYAAKIEKVSIRVVNNAEIIETGSTVLWSGTIAVGSSSTSGVSCTNNGQTYADGQTYTIPLAWPSSEPVPVVTYVCTNGQWIRQTQTASGATTQLANALTALEEALKVS